jgi:uncharacterized protein YfaS (alpha-2-macroglobulin family)
MASDLRATAQLLLLWLERDPQHPLVTRLARWLSSARELDGTWGTTQSNAWGLLALASYLERREAAAPDLRVTAQVGDRSLGPVRLSGQRASQRFDVSMAELPRAGAHLALDKQGRGALHYTLRLAYARSEPPATPEERGFFVERSYERVPAAALARGEAVFEASEQARAGDYVRVTLRLAVPATRRFVVVEDPLPAGLEPVNFAWANEAQAAAVTLAEPAFFDHRELRDDRVVFAATQLEPGLYTYRYLARATTPGRYLAPPARAEEMYHPETFGRTGTRTFEVVGP